MSFRKPDLGVFLKMNAGLAEDHPYLFDMIDDWAQAQDHGSLPVPSAKGFRDWLYEMWGEWSYDASATAHSVLKGALQEWIGGRPL